MTSVFEHNALRLRVKQLETEVGNLNAVINRQNTELEKHRELLLKHLRKFDELNLIIESLKK